MNERGVIILDNDNVSIGSVEVLNNNYEGEDCIICMDIITDNKYIKANHGFVRHPYAYHIECWNSYIKDNNVCPLCREMIVYNEPPNVIIRTHERQYVDVYIHNQMLIIETIMFCSTLGHSFIYGLNNPFAIIALKSCISFFATYRLFSDYLNNFQYNPLKYVFSFYICYSIVNNLMNNYGYFVDYIVNEANDYLLKNL
jgi:hypothetical protein